MMAPLTFLNINNGSRDRLDFYGEWEANWNPQWISQLGIRSASVKMDTGAVHGYSTAGMMSAQYVAESTAFNNQTRQRTDHNWDLTALARYTPSQFQVFEFGYAQKTRSPNLYERYTWSSDGMGMAMNSLVNDGNGYVGNLNLKPEVAHTLSFSADFHDEAQEQWGLKVTPYYTQVQNYIDAQRCTSIYASCTGVNKTRTTGFVNLQFINQSARLYGMDVSGHFPIVKSSGFGSLTASGTLNYTNGKNQTTGNNLYNIMPLNAKLAVVQQFGSWNNTVEWHLVNAKTQVSQVRNEMKTGGYGLINLRSRYDWKQIQFNIGVENILNKLYADPLSGAYIGQGSTMSLNGANAPWGVPVPGMGRSINAGMTVRF
jgi:iron complex outermembrane receptor protein